MKYRNFAHSLDIIMRQIRKLIGKLNLFYFYWWGIEYNKGITFHGRCYLKKYPNSKIVVGKDCSFLSLPFSNQIGINRPCMLSTQSESAIIVIGDNCGFSGTVIGAFRFIKIGNNVRCGANTLITDADWHSDDPRSGKPADVIIEDNVWLGVNVIVLKGVTIGNNSVIGAGSVVTKNIPPNVVAGGNPCKVLKPIL